MMTFNSEMTERCQQTQMGGRVGEEQYIVVVETFSRYIMCLINIWCVRGCVNSLRAQCCVVCVACAGLRVLA